jgi:hypothetical protein
MGYHPSLTADFVTVKIWKVATTSTLFTTTIYIGDDISSDDLFNFLREAAHNYLAPEILHKIFIRYSVTVGGFDEIVATPENLKEELKRNPKDIIAITVKYEPRDDDRTGVQDLEGTIASRITRKAQLI